MKNGPRSGGWPFPGPGATTAATTGPVTALKLADLEKTVEKLRGLPPTKWMLVSPDGHVWADEDPMKLAHILAMRKFSLGTTASGIAPDVAP